jgi:DNA-binding MarR family transcriptional regulator
MSEIPIELDLLGLLKALQTLERNASVSLMYSGLRIPQFRMLNEIDRLDQCTVTELTELLSITRGSCSAQVSELVKNGLLISVEHPSDRRSFYVCLTEHGRAKLSVARRDLGVMQKELKRQLDAASIESLNAFATRMLMGHHPSV